MDSYKEKKIMKRSLLIFAIVTLSGASASAEVVKVFLQVEGCLRSTCSRKVWQALRRTAQSSSFKVDDAEAGIAEFSPNQNVPLNLRALNRSIHDAGYGVKRVAIEVNGKSDLVVAKQECAREQMPELWIKQAKN